MSQEILKEINDFCKNHCMTREVNGETFCSGCEVTFLKERVLYREDDVLPKTKPTNIQKPEVEITSEVEKPQVLVKELCVGKPNLTVLEIKVEPPPGKKIVIQRK